VYAVGLHVLSACNVISAAMAVVFGTSSKGKLLSIKILNMLRSVIIIDGMCGATGRFRSSRLVARRQDFQGSAEYQHVHD